MMRSGERNVQRRVALALAHLCSPDDQKTIFIDSNGKYMKSHFIKLAYHENDFCNFCLMTHTCHTLVGLVLLLELLESSNSKHQRDSSMALCRLANKESSLSPMDAAPPSPIPQVMKCSLLFLWR